jgi:hypothetical protein
MAKLVGSLRDAANFAKKGRVLRRDPQATELWRAKYEELTPGRDDLIGKMLSRGPAITLRVSEIYALLAQSEVVTEEHLKAALALWSFNELGVRYIFSGSQAPTDEEEILRELRANRATGMSTNEIRRKVFASHTDRTGKKGKNLNLILSRMLTKRLIHFRENRDTGGRPAKIWFPGLKAPDGAL